MMVEGHQRHNAHPSPPLVLSLSKDASTTPEGVHWGIA